MLSSLAESSTSSPLNRGARVITTNQHFIYLHHECGFTLNITSTPRYAPAAGTVFMTRLPVSSVYKLQSVGQLPLDHVCVTRLCVTVTRLRTVVMMETGAGALPPPHHPHRLCRNTSSHRHHSAQYLQFFIIASFFLHRACLQNFSLFTLSLTSNI